MIANKRQKTGAAVRHPVALIEEFARWTLDPDRQGNQNDWATAHGVHPATLSDWERRPEYKSALERWRDEIRPRFGEVAAAIFGKAKRGEVPAARLLTEILGEKAPTVTAGTLTPDDRQELTIFQWPEYRQDGSVIRPADPDYADVEARYEAEEREAASAGRPLRVVRFELPEDRS